MMLSSANRRLVYEKNKGCEWFVHWQPVLLHDNPKELQWDGLWVIMLMSPRRKKSQKILQKSAVQNGLIKRPPLVNCVVRTGQGRKASKEGAIEGFNVKLQHAAMHYTCVNCVNITSPRPVTFEEFLAACRNPFSHALAVEIPAKGRRPLLTKPQGSKGWLNCHPKCEKRVENKLTQNKLFQKDSMKTSSPKTKLFNSQGKHPLQKYSLGLASFSSGSCVAAIPRD